MAPGATGWDVLSLGLGVGSSAAAVTAALWGVWKLSRRVWDHTIGRRRAQAAILDQLACTVSQAYIESLLGVPRFIANPGADLEERIYRLPGAWVAIQFKGTAVHLFSITITDADMWYRTGGMTLGVIDLKLGQDTFALAREGFDGEQLWIGNRQAGYYRHYHFGGAGGGHQHFWLSFNAVGAGNFDRVAGPFSSGIYGDQGDTVPDSTKITANTLTILSPFGSIEDVHGRDLFGPHIETMNLIWSERKKKMR
jgi:hypothetical protein